MAREITLSGSLSLLKLLARDQMQGSGVATMTGDHFVHAVQDVGDTDEALDKGDIGTIGYCMFRNNSLDSDIQIGVTSGQYGILLKPGEIAGPVRMNGTAVHAIADPYESELEYLIIEE